MKKLFLFIFLFPFIVHSQNDTIIDNIHYEIVARQRDGKVKWVGQFGDDCSGHKHVKLGTSLKFNRKGKIIKKELYYYGFKHNKQFLGIKYGWWGLFGKQTKYFFGFQIHSVITDPCF